MTRLTPFFAISITLLAPNAHAFVPAVPVLPFKISVTTCSDNLTAGDGACSLREAIKAYHFYKLGGVYNSAECPLAAPPSNNQNGYIALPECNPWLMELAPLTAATGNVDEGDLDIFDAISIVGKGADKTILDGNGHDRLFSNWSSLSLGHMTLRNGVAFSGPTGALDGGAIYTPGALTLSNVIIKDNCADHGGGFYAPVQSPKVTMSAVTIEGNTTGPTGFGGGFVTQCNLNAYNVTVSENSSADRGGALIVALPGVTGVLAHVTIANNTADKHGGLNYFVAANGSLTFDNTLIVNNVAATGPKDCERTIIGSVGPVSALNANFVSDGGTCGAAFSNTQSTAIQGPIKVGGSPQTVYALLPGHPALDAGPCAAGIDYDVRTKFRPAGAACDAGSYERQDVDVSVSLTAPATTTVGTPFTLTAVVAASGSATQVPLTITLPDGYSATGTTGASCQPTGQTLTCDIPVVLAGSPVTVTTKVSGPAGSKEFTASASSFFESEINSANNTAIALVAVAPVANLAISAPAFATATAGSPTTLKFSIDNYGPSSSDIATINVTGASVTSITSTNAAANCTGSVCSLQSVDNAATVEFSVALTFAQAGDSKVTYSLSASHDPDQSNDSATTTVKVAAGENTVSTEPTLTYKPKKTGCGCKQAPMTDVLVGIFMVVAARTASLRTRYYRRK